MICFCLFLNNTSKNWLSFCPFSLFSKKSGLFFARSGSMIFTRALGTPSARVRMGRTSRWWDIAVFGHRDVQSFRWSRIVMATQHAQSTSPPLEISDYTQSRYFPEKLYTLSKYLGQQHLGEEKRSPRKPRWKMVSISSSAKKYIVVQVLPRPNFLAWPRCLDRVCKCFKKTI